VSVAALLLVAAVLLELSFVALTRVFTWSVAHPREAASEEPVGRGVAASVAPLLTSPYFAGLALYVLLLTVGQTFLYLQQAAMVAAAATDDAGRVALFARIDLAVNVATLATQLLVTGQILARLGLAAGLLTVPLLTAAGFVTLIAAPGLTTLALFQSARRAAQYAIERPGREVLYTVVPREERYTAKNVIDTVVFRLGDALSGWLREGLRGAGIGTTGLSVLAATLSVFWGGLALGLARRHGDRERVLT
jgi:AAA family ATP:ADP antiporter